MPITVTNMKKLWPERLALAVEFADMDLEHRSKGEWMVLRERFEAIYSNKLSEPFGSFGADEVELVPSETERSDGRVGGYGYVSSFSERDYAVLQERVRKVLSIAASPGFQGGGHGYAVDTTARFRIWSKTRDTPRLAFGIDAPPADIFLIGLLDALRRAPADIVRKCPREGCGKYFIRNRRQAWCSSKCGTAHNTEKWRERQKAATAKKAPRRKRR